MRYIILVLLNTPVIILALTNIVVQFKLKKVSAQRYYGQLALWSTLLVVLIGSFPIYNLLTGNSALDSSELTAFDIVQTTAIIYLVYVINSQRRKIENTEKIVRNLHQEISIKLSD